MNETTQKTYDRRLKKLTKLEKELINVLSNLTFYAGHSQRCSYILRRRACDCKAGAAWLASNKILKYYGMGFYEDENIRLRVDDPPPHSGPPSL